MLNTFPAVPPDPGVTRQVLSDSPGPMMVSFTFARGAVGKPPDHSRVRATCVRTGRIAFPGGDNGITFDPDEGFEIPPRGRRGCRCIESGVPMDTFTPRNYDFL